MCNNAQEPTHNRGDIAATFGLHSTEMTRGDALRYSQEMDRLIAAGKLDVNTLPSAKKSAPTLTAS